MTLIHTVQSLQVLSFSAENVLLSQLYQYPVEQYPVEKMLSTTLLRGRRC